MTYTFSLPSSLTRRAHPGLVLLTTSLGVLIAQIDTSVVNLATKHIGADLNASVSALQWVIDAYNLVYASFLLTGGTLGDLYGRRLTFMLGIVLFTLGSLICGVAPNATALIAGRAVTGLGAALELPTSLALLTVAYPDSRKRVWAIGVWAGCNGLGMIIGTTIGGLLVDSVGWRSIFLVIIPICVAMLLLSVGVVSETSQPKGRRLDLMGQALAVTALGSLSFAAIEGAHLGWTSAPVLTAITLLVISVPAFVRVERGQSGGLVPFDLFHSRVFSVALAVAACMTFGMYAMLFLTPLYLQTVRHASALVAGFEMLPLAVTFVALAQYSGRLANSLGARVVMTSGMMLMGLGCLLMGCISDHTAFWPILLALVAIGAGLGLNAGPVMAVAVANAPAARSGTASGLGNTARIVGATLGVAMLGAIFAAHSGGEGSQRIADLLTGWRLAYRGASLSEFLGAALVLFLIRGDSHLPPKA